MKNVKPVDHPEEMHHDLLGAVQRGDLPSVQNGLQLHCHPMTDANGNSLLLHALHRRHWTIAEALLSSGVNVNVQDRRGWTPLFWASLNGHADVVAFLITHGADPNLPTTDGECALLVAAYKGYVDITRLLLMGEARLDGMEVEGLDILTVARLRGHQAIVECLESSLRIESQKPS